jgi:hypothetical protein
MFGAEAFPYLMSATAMIFAALAALTIIRLVDHSS